VGRGISPDGQRLLAGAYPPLRLFQAAPSEQVDHWRTEEHAAALRIKAEQRERAATEERARATRIEQWLVLCPLKVSGTNGTAALDEPLLPSEASLRPRPGDRIRIGPDARGWTAVREGGFPLDFCSLAKRFGAEHD
jgi:hypothetical protein